MYIHIPAGKRSRKQQDLLFLTQLGLFQDPGVLAITDLLSPSPPQIELLGHAHRAPDTEQLILADAKTASIDCTLAVA